jgi:hypothetical protein
MLYPDSGRVVAAECDAHMGLHLLAAEFPLTGRGFRRIRRRAPRPSRPRILGGREAGARTVAAAAR